MSTYFERLQQERERYIDTRDLSPVTAPAPPAPWDWAACTCHHDCGEDTLSGTWHQHETEPCPVHPDAPVVG
jgi:hypothetical protein